MADARRNQEHMGIDTNVLVAYLDKDHPNHNETRWLADRNVALNPTLIHEAYHTLVFKMKWKEEDASQVLKEAMTDENNLFINQLMKTTRTGLNLAVEHHLGGRDALILASFLVAKISECFTYDETLLKLNKVRCGRASLELRHS